MAWVVLFVAGLFEIAWAIGLKYSSGFTRLWPTLATLACMTVSMFLLGWSARSLPIGTAYAVWVGIGAFGAVVLGIVLFGEPLTASRLVFLLLLIVAVIGLKFSGH
jgi:quaternary ammonium compound-resistance protein SugE